jgi:hypothetical protein
MLCIQSAIIPSSLVLSAKLNLSKSLLARPIPSIHQHFVIIRGYPDAHPPAFRLLDGLQKMRTPIREDMNLHFDLCVILLISYPAPSSCSPRNQCCSVVAICQVCPYEERVRGKSMPIPSQLTFQSFCALFTMENNVPVAPNMTVNRPICQL